MGQPIFPNIKKGTKLKDLIGPKSWVLFSKFPSRDTEWLSTSPKTWSKDTGYLNMVEQVTNLKIVNDIAERGVKLVTDYAPIITNNEDQKQALYQVVEEQRRILPKVTKERLKLLNSD